MSTKTTVESPLANITSEIEERQCDLINRQLQLKNKVITIERSIPAMMAYNMWKAEQDCYDGSYNKVREIMNIFAPQSDPADKLVAELKSVVHSLHQETTQLHDKIIDADVKLEETDMELESLELANKEMEEKLAELRNKIQKRKTPSLHSIHSEDLICLKKIRQFAEEELKLKNYIRELESKEFMYRRQMSKLLCCKKCQRDSEKIELKETDKKLFGLLEDYTRNKYMTKKKCQCQFENRKRKTCCSCATSITLTAYEKASVQTCEKLCPSLSCCVPLDHRVSRTTANKSRDCICCKSCRRVSSAVFKSKSPDVLQASKQLTQSSVPCDPSKTCDECTTSSACKQINICRYDCEEKRKHELCNCNVRSLDEAYQSISSEMMHLESELDSNSDEEFSECCSCCEDDLL
ncbi:PREDICTED: uncharacterized protein LOC108684450 [Atta colombica]|uniref:uncharacterized protein LOC108684450 n=1 Tax=Atta colombica TaxID=520822 RepID=UPI00084C9F2A|nr:PREDICTED: uncharacterized protein LOC108684450 [Atta colombica]